MLINSQCRMNVHARKIGGSFDFALRTVAYIKENSYHYFWRRGPNRPGVQGAAQAPGGVRGKSLGFCTTHCHNFHPFNRELACRNFHPFNRELACHNFHPFSRKWYCCNLHQFSCDSVVSHKTHTNSRLYTTISLLPCACIYCHSHCTY